MKRGAQNPCGKDLLPAVPLLLAIVLAPLFFGGTTKVSLLVIDILCFFSLLFCVVYWALRKAMPAIPRGFWIPVVLLTLLGGVHCAFPHYSFRAESWSFLPINSAISWLPGSVDQATSLEAFRHVLAISAAACVFLVSARHHRARWWILRVVALSGFAVALIGVGQKAGGLDRMLWATPEESGHLFFGAFRYHGNAAAFLNLCWPASFALWLRQSQRTSSDPKKSFWMAVCIITVAAVFVNSSKAGHIIACCFLALAVWRFWRHLPFRGQGWIAPAFGGGVLLLFAGVVVVPGLATSMEKWDEVVTDGSTWKGRLMAYQICFSMLGDSGLWGNGPGTFRLVFPFYTSEVGSGLSGLWYHAHNDYLQTWIEWGFVGVVLFGVILIGGIRRAIRKIRYARRRRRLEISTSCALLGVGSVVVHALVDFPFQIPAIQLPLVAFLAFFWVEKKARRSEHHPYTTDARMQHPGVNRARRDLENV